MGSDVWMRPLGPVVAEGAAWLHFHSVAEALRFLHSEAGGSLRHLKHLGVTSCPPSRTPYTHDVRIFYISSLSMLFDICEQCWYHRCVTSIEMGGDVLALGIRFI